ncbi:hypothetical protein [Chakrabartyella piscis]|uniref:YczE/YyaS/YitT family protein n=1 Tax=Chakrabartyella piscis TaxID=2918914 RepID=UPI002958BEF2|nr:hypothetical protein [Chakrabartyella piscis]
MAMEYVKRLIQLNIGLFLYALGVYVCIQANIGLAPWEAFHMGFSFITGVSMGNICIIFSILIIGLALLLKEKIGIGSILNALIIGVYLDALMLNEVIPAANNLVVSIITMIIGIFIIALASYMYIGSAMGCGPRDTLMVALGKRFQKIPVGAIRGSIEGSVLLIGWFCGAPIGLGTVLYVFGIGYIMQFVFRVLHFDVKGVQHENVLDTFKIWTGK